MQPEFDAVIVGAGPAGSACAITLARNGLNVLMLEKAKIPGEKNVTGGVLYGNFIPPYGLTDLIPEFEKEAPLERKIMKHEIYVVSTDKKGELTKYYRMTKSSLWSKLGLAKIPSESGHDYTVLRRKFDRWFSLKAVEAGAMLSTQSTVTDLIMEQGRIAGVSTQRGDVISRVVVDCSGVTSNLLEKAGLRERLKPEDLYHGIKRVYKLDSSTIEKRFGLNQGEGSAIFLMGDFMYGIHGGAFVYTNYDTLSVGIVASMTSMIEATTTRFNEIGKLLDAQDRLESTSLVGSMIDGAQLVEYSAHNIPKGYRTMLSTPYTDGFLVAGDALGTFVKVGSLIDGMRRAIASGIMAAETIMHAYRQNSFDKKVLSLYKQSLAPIYRDINYSKRDSIMSESFLAYRLFPKLVISFGKGVQKEKNQYKQNANLDAIQRVQSGTGLLTYDEDKYYSHIKVNTDLCSKSVLKPWVPACPMNCYTIFSKKGVFASYRDLFLHNLSSLGSKAGDKGYQLAMSETFKDIAESELRFDHVACVACGTCGVIGPEEMVTFTHELDGHGVRYRYG
ncbi:MAG: FAD-dependent oxidoreductase [Conexivisphaerales archaeon]